MTSIDSRSDLLRKVDTYMQALVTLDQFSGSLLIARNGEALVSKGYGFANREHGVPNTPQTKFRLGSITKQFTAMAILILQEQGKLQVGDPILRVLPDCPAAWESVTIHHLLNHTSGIPSFTRNNAWKTIARVTRTVQEIIDMFKEKPLDFQPGEGHQYSNSGYILLGQIIQHVSGMSYETFLDKHIFEPLGMENSGYDWSETVLEHRASGYSFRDNKFFNADYHDMSIPFAAGALYSTVEDLLLWDQALYSEQLVPRERLEAMFMLSPFLANYGYGFRMGRQFNRRWIGHGGGINGFLTHLIRYPDEKLFIVVLSNLGDSNPREVANTLAAIVFGEEYGIPEGRTQVQLEPDVYQSLAGDYQLAPGLVISIEAGDQRIVARGTGGGKTEFFPTSESIFLKKVGDDQITFFRNETGTINYLVLRQEGLEERADKIG